MSIVAHRRRWFQFGLRSLFVSVTIMAVVLGIRVGWRPEWIRQRHEFLAQQERRNADLPPVARQLPGRPTYKPTAGYRTRFVLWFFGDEFHSEVCVRYVAGGGMVLASEFEERAREEGKIAAALFPEATIRVVAMPYHPQMGPSWIHYR